MPEDIPMYQPIWSHVRTQIVNGVFAVNQEIYDELCYLPGNIGTCLNGNKNKLVLEVGEAWNWQTYLATVEDMRVRYKSVISEYNNNRRGTVGLNDVAIVALAKTLKLPLINMEAKSFQTSATKIRIPGLCILEGVEPLEFNDFLTRG